MKNGYEAGLPFDMEGRVLIGTGKFGGVVPDGDCFDFLDLYYDLGGRVIDSGHCYGMFYPGVYRQPLSERVIGKYLASRGDKSFAVCTKGGYFDIDTREPRVNPRDLRADLEGSLNELQRDYIDLYYIHRDDPSLPVSDIVPIWDGFYREGKIRAAGVSNWTTTRVKEANDFAAANGMIPISAVQNLYSLGSYADYPMNDKTMRVTTDADLRAFKELGVNFAAYSSQAYGFFSKVDLSDEKAALRLIAEKYPFFDPESSLERARRAARIAKERGAAVSAVVLSFVLSRDTAPAAVIGCTKESQLREAMSAMELRLSAEEIAYLQQPVAARAFE